MEAQPDFKYLLELFKANKVEYLIVGGYALAYHGAPRATIRLKTEKVRLRPIG